MFKYILGFAWIDIYSVTLVLYEETSRRCAACVPLSYGPITSKKTPMFHSSDRSIRFGRSNYDLIAVSNLSDPSV